MANNLECPYGIPEDQCCNSPTCRTYQARQFQKREQKNQTP
ncbi:MAG: hypothetical protein ACBZ72_01680 [Candidatus Bathyarchaeia archaeon]